MRIIPVSGKQRQRFEVGLLLLALRFGIGQRAVKQPDQLARFAARFAKHAEVKLVVRDHVDIGVDADEPACGAQMQRPPGRRRHGKIEVADLGEGEHLYARVAADRLTESTAGGAGFHRACRHRVAAERSVDEVDMI